MEITGEYLHCCSHLYTGLCSPESALILSIQSRPGYGILGHRPVDELTNHVPFVSTNTIASFPGAPPPLLAWERGY